MDLNSFSILIIDNTRKNGIFMRNSSIHIFTVKLIYFAFYPISNLIQFNIFILFLGSNSRFMRKAAIG